MSWQTATVEGARRLLCISSNTVLKSARVISSQYFTCKGEEGEKKPHAALRQGRRQMGQPSFLQGSYVRRWVLLLCCPSKVAQSGSGNILIPIRRRRLAHLLHHLLLKTLETDNGRDGGQTRLVYATEVYSLAC